MCTDTQLFPVNQVWLEIPLCTASVTDRKAQSCILIWSFAEHMERIETPSSSLQELMVHCAAIWNIIMERSECLICVHFFLLVSFRVWTLACGGMCWQLKMFYFQNFAKQVQARPQCHSHCSPACWMLLTSAFHPMTVGTLPASWSFSLSWEIIFSQVMTLPCFLLIFYTISPRAQSLCFTPCFVLLLSSVYRLITLLSPHHISPSPSPSSPLSPLLSSKCVCVFDKSAMPRHAPTDSWLRL